MFRVIHLVLLVANGFTPLPILAFARIIMSTSVHSNFTSFHGSSLEDTSLEMRRSKGRRIVIEIMKKNSDSKLSNNWPLQSKILYTFQPPDSKKH